MARGEQRTDSDVDLLLIGEAALSELAIPLHEAGTALGMHISPTLMSVDKLVRIGQLKPEPPTDAEITIARRLGRERMSAATNDFAHFVVGGGQAGAPEHGELQLQSIPSSTSSKASSLCRGGA